MLGSSRDTVRIPAGERLFRPGQTPLVAVVSAGIVRVFMRTAGGRQTTLRYARTGDLIGLAAVLGYMPGWDAEAATDATVQLFGIDEILKKGDVLTTDFAYIRWLGDRKGIEERTQRWDRLIIDRTRDMGRWIPNIRRLIDEGTTVYGYFNNHYAGYGIGSIRLFREMWDQGGPSDV